MDRVARTGHAGQDIILLQQRNPSLVCLLACYQVDNNEVRMLLQTLAMHVLQPYDNKAALGLGHIDAVRYKI